MKIIIISLTFCFFWCSHISVAQKTDTVQKSPEIERQIIILSEKLSILLNEKESQYTGKIQVYNKNILVYSKKSHQNLEKNKNLTQEAAFNRSKDGNIEIDSVKIDSVEISISDGVIAGIRVFTNSGIYENTHQIGLQNFNKSKIQILIYNIKDKNLFLKLRDFLQYLPRVGENFLPDDEDFVLKPNGKLKELKASVDLNSFIELQINTDFLSIFNKKPNGLIQTEAKSRFLLYTAPNKKNGYVFNYLEASFKYSKFDSQFEFLEIADSTGIIEFDTKNRLLLNQYSFLNLGVRSNVYKIKYPRFLSEFNIGLQYDLTDVKYRGSTDILQVDLFSFLVDMQSGVLRSKNFGFNIGFTALGQFIASRNIEIVRPTTKVYFMSGFSAFYHPKNDKLNKVFIKFRTMAELGAAQFINFQIGYSAKINLKA